MTNLRMDTARRVEVLEVRTRLSTLWVFLLLNMIFRDIHEIPTVDFLEQALSGVVNGTEVTEGGLFLGAFLVEIPIAMVVLTQFLRVEANRVVNVVTGSVMVVLLLLNTLTPDLDDMFFATVEVLTLALIIGYAWRWPGRDAMAA